MLQAAMKHVPEAAQEPQVVTAKGPWARTWALQALWAWASFELQAAGELQTHFCGPVAIINWNSKGVILCYLKRVGGAERRKGCCHM